MRDKIKNDGLESLLKELNTYISFYKEDINEARDEKTRSRLQNALIDETIKSVIASYSIGKSMEEVKMIFTEAINTFNKYFQWEGVELGYGDYDYMVWMVSLGVLCDLEPENFQKITAVIKRDNAQDKLLDFIIKSKQPNWEGVSDQYIQAIPYAQTANIETAGDIKQYLDKVWYQGHDEAYWHDLHKNTKANNYFGYWAWEVAAIAKIKGIDDTDLKDHPFYPYDAVHW